MKNHPRRIQRAVIVALTTAVAFNLSLSPIAANNPPNPPVSKATSIAPALSQPVEQTSNGKQPDSGSERSEQLRDCRHNLPVSKREFSL